jgi:hypothetical protein
MSAPYDPVAYQELLLSHLGDDDPYEAQSATAGAMRELVESAGPLLAERPAEGEWSGLEILGHITDAEIVYSGRYRWILAHDEPPLIGYDQDAWVGRLRHAEVEPRELLDVFEALRRANLRLWERTSPEERSRIGQHEERGPESYELSFRLIAGHDRVHLAQARATVSQVIAARGD